VKVGALEIGVDGNDTLAIGRQRSRKIRRDESLSGAPLATADRQ